MKYIIRYNTNNNGDTNKIWRIINNNKEILVKDIKINVPSCTETTIENKIVKYNITCSGNLVLQNNIAIINRI